MTNLKHLIQSARNSLALFIGGFGRKRESLPGDSNSTVMIPASEIGELEPEPGRVRFGIRQSSRRAQSDGEEITWLATYKSKSGSARFEISLILPKPGGKPSFGISKGTFISDRNSDYSEFLRAVANALEADKIEAGEPRTDRLEILCSVFGQNVKNRADGAQGRADWTLTKIYVADGEGEFFLNLNPKAGIGEISIKDSGYGDIVVRELSRVFHTKDELR
jgi:hypothetical protein